MHLVEASDSSSIYFGDLVTMAIFWLNKLIILCVVRCFHRKKKLRNSAKTGGTQLWYRSFIFGCKKKRPSSTKNQHRELTCSKWRLKKSIFIRTSFFFSLLILCALFVATRAPLNLKWAKAVISKFISQFA